MDFRPLHRVRRTDGRGRIEIERLYVRAEAFVYHREVHARRRGDEGRNRFAVRAAAAFIHAVFVESYRRIGKPAVSCKPRRIFGFADRHVAHARSARFPKIARCVEIVLCSDALSKETESVVVTPVG